MKLGYNELGYNELPVIVNTFKESVWFSVFHNDKISVITNRTPVIPNNRLSETIN